MKFLTISDRTTGPRFNIKNTFPGIGILITKMRQVCDSNFFILGIPLQFRHHVDGLVQGRRNSIANALELRLSCTNPSMVILRQLSGSVHTWLVSSNVIISHSTSDCVLPLHWRTIPAKCVSQSGHLLTSRLKWILYQDTNKEMEIGKLEKLSYWFDKLIFLAFFMCWLEKKA